MKGYSEEGKYPSAIKIIIHQAEVSYHPEPIRFQ
jgi:hypothetical protein